MRAAVFEKAGEKLRIRDVPMPVPGPGELLVKIRYCGVCGSDLHLTDPASCFHPKAGAVIGHEFCGEIVARGDGAGNAWQEGQRVAALPYIGCRRCVQCLAGNPVFCPGVRSKPSGVSSGGFAEFTVVGAAETLALPDALSWEEGAFVEPIAVGVHAVRKARMAPGSRVLVIGAGPVGLAVAACARASGAGPICVTARSSRRAERAARMGASAFLPHDENLAQAFADTAGGPPEIIFECVGLPGMLDLSCRLAGPHATVVVMGACLQEDRLLPIVPTMKELRLQFVVCYDRRDFATAIDLIASRRVMPLEMLTDVVDLDAFPDALENLRGAHSQCKILMAPSG